MHAVLHAVFVVRTKQFMFRVLPGKLLFAASMLCWVVTALIAGLMSYKLNLLSFQSLTYPNGQVLHVPVVWQHVDGLMLLYSYLICIALMLIEEAAKLTFYAVWNSVGAACARRRPPPRVLDTKELKDGDDVVLRLATKMV